MSRAKWQLLLVIIWIAQTDIVRDSQLGLSIRLVILIKNWEQYDMYRIVREIIVIDILTE